MRLLSRFGRCVMLSLTVVALTAMSYSPHAFMTLAGANGSVHVVFVADNETNAVYELNADNLNAPPLGVITNGIDQPAPLGVDGQGILYVGNSSTVTEYKPGSLTPFRTLHLGILVESLAVSADGTLAVGGNRSFFSPGKLFIFDKGSPKPTRIIPIPLKHESLAHPIALAVDSKDDVVVSIARYPGGGEMLSFAPGATHGVGTGFDPAIGEGFDASDNFYLNYGTLIDKYAAGTHTLIRRLSTGLTNSVRMAVTPDGRVFAPNAESFDYGLNQDINGNVLQYGASGPKPVQMLQSSIDEDPRGMAYRP